MNEPIDSTRISAARPHRRSDIVEPDSLQGSADHADWITAPHRFEIHYQDLSDTVRHFSSVRSALTAFLLVSGTALLTVDAHVAPSPFRLCAAILFLSAAMAVCLVFSYRTEKFIFRRKTLWKWSHSSPPAPYPRFPDDDARDARILREMTLDVMNWVVLGFLLIVGVAYALA